MYLKIMLVMKDDWRIVFMAYGDTTSVFDLITAMVISLFDIFENLITNLKHFDLIGSLSSFQGLEGSFTWHQGSGALACLP